MTSHDAFRSLLRAHARECPLPDGAPDFDRHLDGAHWARFARLGWVEPLGPAPCDQWRLSPEGRAIAQSVQLHAGRPPSPETAARQSARAQAQSLETARRKLRAMLAYHGPETVLEALQLETGA